MNELKFTYNWNNKLDCKMFTTLRLHNANKYYVGNTFDVFLKDKKIKKVEVIDIKIIKINEINEFIAGLDTGYSIQECKKILFRMYYRVDWSTQKLDFVLLKTL